MLGMPELMIVLTVVAFRIAPLLAVVWALVVLRRIRAEQQATQVKLDAIERLLQRS
jgi:hypothetical protein